jgi:hypothetical protein
MIRAATPKREHPPINAASSSSGQLVHESPQHPHCGRNVERCVHEDQADVRISSSSHASPKTGDHAPIGSIRGLTMANDETLAPEVEPRESIGGERRDTQGQEGAPDRGHQTVPHVNQKLMSTAR